MKYIFFICVFLLCSCSKNSINKETTVGIIPYKGIDKKKVVMLQKAIEGYYGVNVEILNSKSLPQSAFININCDVLRQYAGDLIIKRAAGNMRHAADIKFTQYFQYRFNINFSGGE